MSVPRCLGWRWWGSLLVIMQLRLKAKLQAAKVSCKALRIFLFLQLPPLLLLYEVKYRTLQIPTRPLRNQGSG